jgi:hypothetical protein
MLLELYPNRATPEAHTLIRILLLNLRRSLVPSSSYILLWNSNVLNRSRFAQYGIIRDNGQAMARSKSRQTG